MDWPKIIGLIFTTGVVSAALNILATYLMARKATERKGRHAAIRLSVILEKYALDCADKSMDINNAISSRGHMGRSHFTLPEIQEYPEDIDWESLTPDMISDVLSFPNEITIRNGTIHEFMDFVDNMDADVECARHCAIQGVRACTIARKLREKHGLGLANYMTEEWDCPQYLEDEVSKHEERMKAQRESQRKTMEKLGIAQPDQTTDHM